MRAPQRLLAAAACLLSARSGAAMRFSHYDWDYHHPSQPYSHVPYGRLVSYFPDAYKYMPYRRNPLYYNPTDPEGSNPKPSTFNFSDPYRGAGYLPRELMGRHNALFPSFGYVPVNYPSPHYHPQFPGGKFQPPSRFSHPEGFMDLVPYDVPMPAWHAGYNHPLYAPWYKPGIAHRRLERPRIQPASHGTVGDERSASLADYPEPNARYRVERPLYMDTPSGPWPSMGVNDPYNSVPAAPPPPPEGQGSGGEAESD